MAVLGIKRIPGKVHGTRDLWLDRHRKVKSQVSPSVGSAQAKTCLVKDKAINLSVLLSVSDVHFVFWRPELVQKIRFQEEIGQRIWVIDEDSVIFPEEGDAVTCMKGKVCI